MTLDDNLVVEEWWGCSTGRRRLFPETSPQDNGIHWQYNRDKLLQDSWTLRRRAGFPGHPWRASLLTAPQHDFLTSGSARGHDDLGLPEATPRPGRDHQLLGGVEFLAMFVPNIPRRQEVSRRSRGALSTSKRKNLGWVSREQPKSPLQTS